MIFAAHLDLGFQLVMAAKVNFVYILQSKLASLPTPDGA
jgi:hypothetical protein